MYLSNVKDVWLQMYFGGIRQFYVPKSYLSLTCGTYVPIFYAGVAKGLTPLSDLGEEIFFAKDRGSFLILFIFEFCLGGELTLYANMVHLRSN